MQRFLHSSKAVTISDDDVSEMSRDEVEQQIRLWRWPRTNGEPVCPECGCMKPYECRRKNGHLRFRCRAEECQIDFSLTSGSYLAHHKKPLATYLKTNLIFVNHVSGVAASYIKRARRLSYKAAFVFCHRIRRAMGSETRDMIIGGPGEIVEIDACYCGGYIKPANYRTQRKDLRFGFNKSHKRRCVVAARSRTGRTIVGVFKEEKDAIHFIFNRVKYKTTIYADTSTDWADLHRKFSVKRINHDKAFSHDGICTNWVEGYFSRLRVLERVHRHIAGPYLQNYAEEAAWREDHRRKANGELFDRLGRLLLSHKPTRDFVRYWRNRKTPTNTARSKRTPRSNRFY